MGEEPKYDYTPLAAAAVIFVLCFTILFIIHVVRSLKKEPSSLFRSCSVPFGTSPLALAGFDDFAWFVLRSHTLNMLTFHQLGP
jgi:hypothetical protein